MKELKSVKGHWTPQNTIYQGKKVRSGIFVNTTGKTEDQKDRLFDLAKGEIGEKAEGLDLYEIISL